MSKITLKPNMPSMLIKAAGKGVAEVQELINRNYSVTDTDGGGNTAIHWTCYRPFKKPDNLVNRANVLVALLNALPPELIDIRNLEGNTPLVVAVASGLIECIKLLIEKGASLYECGQNELLPLTIACLNRDFTTIKLLLKSGAGVNTQNRSGETVMHQIFKHWQDDQLTKRTSSSDVLHKGKFESVWNILLAYGADINRGTRPESYGGGETPLHYAAEYGCASGVRFLLDNGAFVDEAPADLRTPLINAVFNGHRTTTYDLIEAGADYLRITINGNSVLHAACSMKLNRLRDLYGSVESLPLERLTSRTIAGKQTCLKFILEQSDYHVNLSNDRGMTPIMCAALSGMHTSVADLIHAHANVALTDLNGRTALHHVCASKNTELVIHDIIECLLDNGANANARDHEKETALHYLCRRKLNSSDLSREVYTNSTGIEHLCIKQPSFFVLLTNGADINAKNKDGNTPLHIACSVDNNVDTIKILVIMGAYVDVENNNEQLPKDCANMWNRSYFEVMMNMGCSHRHANVTPTVSLKPGRKCTIS